MGKAILVIGEPGTGKTRGIINLPPDKTVIVSPNNKDLPFKGGSTMYSKEKNNYFRTVTFDGIKTVIEGVDKKMPNIKYIIIEDLTHYLSERVMQDAKIKSYDKWTDLGVDVFNALVRATSNVREDLWIIVIAHTMTSTDVQGNQIITIQTAGKLLDNVIKIPSYFTYVLHTDPVLGADHKMQYRFLTNTDGVRIAKSPEGCLDLHEENDYAQIINKIETYQN